MFFFILKSSKESSGLRNIYVDKNKIKNKVQENTQSFFYVLGWSGFGFFLEVGSWSGFFHG